MKESERKTETDGGRIAEWSKRLLQKDNFVPQQQEAKNERKIEQSKRSKMKKKQRE